MLTRRLTSVVLAAFVGLAGSLAFATAAQAKGATTVTVTGPGLASPVRLSQQDGPQGEALLALARDIRLDWVALGNPGDMVLDTSAPGDRLGAAYEVTFGFGCVESASGGACEPVEVRLVAYPFAVMGPVVAVPGGQHRPYEKIAIAPGWVRASPVLPQTMLALGIPAPLRTVAATATATAVARAEKPGRSVAALAMMAFGGVLAVVVIVLLAARRHQAERA